MNDKYKTKLKFLVLLATIVLSIMIGRLFHIDTATLQGYLKKFPLFYSGLIFVLLYVVVTFFIWFSKDIFRFTAAVLFGATLSTLFIWLAETLNAGVLFYLARKLGREFVQDSLKKRKYSQLDEKLGKVSFLWLFLFRLVPLIPFRFLDLGTGLSRVSFRRYLLAVVLGSPLRIFWVQYALAGVGEALFKTPFVLAKYLSQNTPLFLFSLVYLVLVMVVALKLKRKG